MKSLLHSLEQLVASIEFAQDTDRLIRYASARVLFDQLREEISSSAVDQKQPALGCLGFSLDLLKWAVFPSEEGTKSPTENIQSALQQLASVRYYIS